MAEFNLGTLEPSEVTEEQYPETGLTEETRQMFTEKSHEAFKSFVDEVLLNKTHKCPELPIDRLKNHEILLDELTIMYDAHMTIGGQQNRFNASVIRAAINVIISCTK
jgi:hypothetical protein